MGKGPVHISLLGTSFTIQADEDPDYLTRIVEYLSKKVKEVESSVSVRDPLRIAILSGLLVADELFKEKSRHRADGESAEVERITLDLIDRIDESLGEK